MIFSKKYEKTKTRAWELYTTGREHHVARNMYEKARRCRRFYEGDQWEGFEDSENMPRLNFIKPIGRHKISTIAQNQISMVFSYMGDGAGEKATRQSEICKKLNRLATSQWERSNMDTVVWSVIKNAFITGGHYLYCAAHTASDYTPWKPQLDIRQVANTAIYFSDEQNPNINEQEYILIAERIPVSQARKIAVKNGMTEQEAELIVSDEESEEGYGKRLENKTPLGKCTSVLLMEKTDEGIAFSRSTMSVTYQKPQTVKGLFCYPIAAMRWEESDGDARGISGVMHLIPNQLEVNKTAARRAVAVKRFSFPTIAYDKTAVSNIDGLSEIGSSIALDNARENPIDSIIQYLNPAPISPDAGRLQSELLQLSRELDGASDAATGLVDPTKASGEAIKAARDQAAIPLSEQACSYRAFIEELARVWLSMWIAYSSNGLLVYEESGERGVIVREELLSLGLDVRVDISPVDPYSRLSQEIALERLLSAGHISFTEYVSSLEDTSGVPKAKLKEIIARRSDNAISDR